jgi:hypothetical protein
VDETLLAWTTLLLGAPGALWLWTKCRPPASRQQSARRPPPAQSAQYSQREESEWSAAAEVLPVLTIEGRGVAVRILGRRVALRSASPTVYGRPSSPAQPDAPPAQAARRSD